MARLSEKNACPNALTTVPGVIAEKSGLRKNSSPADALSSDSDTPQNISSKMKSTGIITFDILSMPACTPRSSTYMFAAIIMTVMTIGRYVPVI